jgi:hypothetical protein
MKPANGSVMNEEEAEDADANTDQVEKRESSRVKAFSVTEAISSIAAEEEEVCIYVYINIIYIHTHEMDFEEEKVYIYRHIYLIVYVYIYMIGGSFR